MSSLPNMIPVLLVVPAIGEFSLHVFLDLRQGEPAHATRSAVARPSDLNFMMSPEWNMRGAANLPRLAGSLRSPGRPTRRLGERPLPVH